MFRRTLQLILRIQAQKDLGPNPCHLTGSVVHDHHGRPKPTARLNRPGFLLPRSPRRYSNGLTISLMLITRTGHQRHQPVSTHPGNMLLRAHNT